MCDSVSVILITKRKCTVGAIQDTNGTDWIEIN